VPRETPRPARSARRVEAAAAAPTPAPAPRGPTEAERTILDEARRELTAALGLLDELRRAAEG